MIRRAVLRLLNAAKKFAEAQVTSLGGQPISGVECFEPYGFTSAPLTGAEGLLLEVGGASDHGVLICCGDRRYRLTALGNGDVAIYDFRGQTIILGAAGVSLKAPKITLDSAQVEITGALSAASVDALLYKVGSVPGISRPAGPVASLTTVNGLVTAAA